MKKGYSDAYTNIKNEIIISSLNDGEYRVLSYLISLEKNGFAFPSIRTMSENLNKSTSTIQKILSSLESKNIIMRENRILGSGKKTSNKYLINENYLKSKKAYCQEEINTDISEQTDDLLACKEEILNYRWMDEIG